MTEMHAALGIVVIVAGVLFIVVAAVAGAFGRERWVDVGRRAVMTVVVAQVVLGVVIYASGTRPQQPLHLLYGIAVLAPLPFARSFAAEAPPKARAWVDALAGLVLVGVSWRLLATG